MTKSSKIKIGISIGDYNGVGIEVILKTFSDRRIFDFCTPIVYANYGLINFAKKELNIEHSSLFGAKNISEIKPFKLNIIDCWKEKIELNFGANEKAAGKYALKSLESAVYDLKEQNINALVTAPINKNNIQSDEFKFPGHTEYLESQSEGKALMLMLSDELRIGVVTGHLPLQRVSDHISKELILEKLQQLNQSLKSDFSIRKPKIAVLGLNPHAGDNGVLGKEESDIIIPAIEKAQEDGLLAFGPYPADGFFGSNKMTAFDAILAMYHDQGLIPFKTLSFGTGVNFTAGINLIRTSPDHGTAYDIAGQNNADESSFRTALYYACDIFKNRSANQKLLANALVIKKQKAYREFKGPKRS